ncbi:MFS transporter [Pseudomonas yamanorum]|uniref:MFS transporter n=1 Tax=Pseudomonas yamanorum TaxID=515393 RepID=A0A7Y8FF66_9PSED|nr:MFS transporter [Pseudomonas yamanorum]NWE77783.1 MFS transporter [Pseudomonas yamanorum]
MTKLSKWHVLIGGFIAYIFDAMEIVLLSVALPVIRGDLGLGINEVGLLVTATLIGMGFSSITIGWYADNFGRRSAMLASLIIFGALTSVLSFVHDFYLFLFIRFLSGVGLGGLWSTVSAYVAESWPEKQRSRATSFVISAFPIGAIVAAVTAKFFLPDWRTLFLFSGLAVILPIFYVYFFVAESQIWKIQKQVNSATKGQVLVSEIFAPELRRSTLLGTLAASFALLGYWGSSTWLPTYLVQERGLSLALMATFIAVLNVGNFLGLNFFGYVADRFGKRITVAISLLLTAGMLPIYLFASNEQSLLWLGPIYAFFIAFAGLFGSLFSQIYPTRVRTLGAGFCFNAGRGLAAFGPVLLSGIASHYSLAAGLMVCASFFVVSAIFVMMLPRTDATKDASDHTDGSIGKADYQPLNRI